MNKVLKIFLIFIFLLLTKVDIYSMGMPAVPATTTTATTPIITPMQATPNQQITPNTVTVTTQTPKAEPLVMGLAPEKEQNITKKEEPKTEPIPVEQKKEEQAQPEKKEKKDVYLNFENAELSSLINYMSEIKKLNLIPGEGLAGKKVSLIIRKPLSPDQAWNVFLTVLEMGGFCIVRRGDVDVVVPNTTKEHQPLPSYINIPFKDLPDSDENIRYVSFLQNISVEHIQNLLQSMLSTTGKVIPYIQANGMVITDKSYNIKSAMKVIQELDHTGLQETVVVMKMKRTNATDVKNLLDSLIQPQAQQNPIARLLGRQSESSLTYFSPSTRIIAEERTNSLILLGNQKSIEKIEKFITENLDTELKGTESPLHIYELQNTDAEQIKNILQDTINAQDPNISKHGGVRGGTKYFRPMNFQVDKDGNRLIVSSIDKQDWKMLKEVIKNLDKPQPQVAIEALVVTVNFSDNKFLGGGIRNKNSNQIGQGVDFQSALPSGKTVFTTGADNKSIHLADLSKGLIGGLGATLLTVGKSANIWAIFEAIKSQSNTTVLSQPFFTVTNNVEASISVGETVYIVTQTTSDNFQGKEAKTANTLLKVKPQINLDGIIRLHVDLDFNVFTNETLGNSDEKKLVTDVTLANGQVLVLGGFVKTKTTEIESKTPLLGDIPILGWMFKNKTKNTSKDYLFIFMSPTIIKPRETPGVNLYTKMKLEDATTSMKESVQTQKSRDPINNWFFNPEKEDYTHKISDFTTAKYQPTNVDIKNDPYYRSTPEKESKYLEKIKQREEEEEKLILQGKKIEKKEDQEEEEALEVKREEKKDNLLEQKREQLKQLLSQSPVIKPVIKKTEPEKITKETSISQEKNKREELKKRLSMATNSNARKLKSRRLA